PWGYVKMNKYTVSLRLAGETRPRPPDDRRSHPMHATETPTPTATPTPTDPDHDERGRFVRGNKGGPGNPYARKMASLRQAMLDAVTDEDMAEVTRAVLAKAKKGDLEAARLLYQYGQGKPPPAPDPDALDAHEMHTYFAQIVPQQLFIQMLH